MKQVVTITFREPDSNEECTVIVRAGGGGVALARSRRDSGDTEVVLPAALAVRIADALRAGAEAV